MDRVKILNFCIAGLILYGMAELSFGGSGDDDLVCLWEQSATCSDVTETNCTHTCQEFTRASGEKYWKCAKADGTYNVIEYVTKKNSYATTVETDWGYCFLGPEQSAVYCATVYTCHGSCSETKLGDPCDRTSYYEETGRRVRPKVVDQRWFCPWDCE